MKKLIIVCFVLSLLVLSVSGISYDEYLSIIGAEQSQESYDYYVANDFAEKSDIDVRNSLGVGLSSPASFDTSGDVQVSPSPVGSGSVSLQNIPSSGSSYSDPVLVGIEYSEAEDGTLLDILYSLFGRPVRAYHYRYQSSSTQGYTYYTVETLDYDVHWCASVVVFLLVLWSIFKLGGVLLSKT